MNKRIEEESKNVQKYECVIPDHQGLQWVLGGLVYPQNSLPATQGWLHNHTNMASLDISSKEISTLITYLFSFGSFGSSQSSWALQTW